MDTSLAPFYGLAISKAILASAVISGVIVYVLALVLVAIATSFVLS